MNKRALVLGGAGMLAKELIPSLTAEGWAVESADLPSVDITREDSVTACVRAAKPAWVFNCAAYTKVDQAETDADACHAVNAQGAALCARAAKKAGARFVQVSTDYVFDGARRTPYPEDAPTRPLGVYARTKRDGEALALAEGGAVYVVRTGELYGSGPNFFAAILKRARAGQGLQVVSDQIVSPTWTRELSRQLVAIAEAAPMPGVFHATCDGETSWYDAAKFALQTLSLEVPVKPISTDEWPVKTPRPLYSVLGHQKLSGLGLYVMRDWRTALAEWLPTV